MSNIMFLSRFKEPILAGTKRQTIRRPRKRPIKPGEPLSLRVWTGKAYRSPQEKLLDTTCSATFEIEILANGYRLGRGLPLHTLPLVLDEFARSDGFADWQEFIGHFDGFYGLPFRGTLIHWEAASV